MKGSLADVPVTRVMRTQLERVPPGLSIDELVREYLLQGDQLVWPIESDSRLLGLVAWDDVRRVPEGLWAQTPAAAVMTTRDKLVTLSRDASAEAALDLMTRHDVEQLTVVDGDRLLGIVHRGDLLKWFALRPRYDDRPRPLTPLHR